MLLKNKKSDRSFTLIELLIVIAIIILLSGLSLAYYHNFTEQKNLQGETKKFIDVLESAKKKTIAGDRSLCGGGAGITPMVRNYSVNVNNSTQYQLSPKCIYGNPTPISYNTASNVGFITPAPTIEFPPLGIGANTGCIIVKNTSLVKCKYVKIERSGIISEGDCSDCASCSCPP